MVKDLLKKPDLSSGVKVFRIEPDSLNLSIADVPPELVTESQRLANQQGRDIDLAHLSQQWHAGNSVLFCRKIRQALELIVECNRQLQRMDAAALFSPAEIAHYSEIPVDRDGRESWDRFYRLKEAIIDRLSDLNPALLGRLNLSASYGDSLKEVLRTAQETMQAEICVCGPPRTEAHHVDLPVWITLKESKSGTAQADMQLSSHHQFVPIEFFLGKKEGDCVTLYLNGRRYRLRCRQKNRILKTPLYACAFPSPFEDYLQIYVERARRLGYLDERVAIKKSWLRHVLHGFVRLLGPKKNAGRLVAHPR